MGIWTSRIRASRIRRIRIRTPPRIRRTSRIRTRVRIWILGIEKEDPEHPTLNSYRAGMKFQFFVRPGKFQCPRDQTMKTLLLLFARFDLESRKWRIKIYFQNL